MAHDPRHFEHIDGSSALMEAKPINPATNQSNEWKAKTYRIAPGTHTGETCCSVFWLRFNQRFHLLRPTEEIYAAEIEKIIYNALLRQMRPRLSATKSKVRATTPCANGMQTADHHTETVTSRPPPPDHHPELPSASTPPGIRYPAAMEREVAAATDENTCCEEQGSRTFGSLPEYFFSLSTNFDNDTTVYVDM